MDLWEVPCIGSCGFSEYGLLMDTTHIEDISWKWQDLRTQSACRMCLTKYNLTVLAEFKPVWWDVRGVLRWGVYFKFGLVNPKNDSKYTLMPRQSPRHKRDNWSVKSNSPIDVLISISPEANKITLCNVTHSPTYLSIVLFRIYTNSTLLHKYRQSLKLKVRVLVKQMLHGHMWWFFKYGDPGSVG